MTPAEYADVVAAQINLLRRLGVEESQVRSATQGIAALRETLAGRRCLLIVDDVWSDAAARAFQCAGPRGRVLYTTRDREVLRAVGARIELVDVLPEVSARELLAKPAETTSDQMPAEVDRILTATGRVALALTLVGAAVGRGGRSGATGAGPPDQGRGGAATPLDEADRGLTLPRTHQLRELGSSPGAPATSTATWSPPTSNYARQLNSTQVRLGPP